MRKHLAGVVGRSSKGRLEVGRCLVKIAFAKHYIVLFLWGPDAEQKTYCSKEQWIVVIYRLARQHLRHHFIFNVDMDLVIVMVRMATEIFEMHGDCGFLPIEA